MNDHDVRQELLETLLERYSPQEIEEQGYLDHDTDTMLSMIHFWEDE